MRGIPFRKFVDPAYLLVPIYNLIVSDPFLTENPMTNLNSTRSMATVVRVPIGPYHFTVTGLISPSKAEDTTPYNIPHYFNR